MESILAALAGFVLAGIVASVFCRARSARAYAEGRASLASENAVLAERLSAREAEVARVAAELAAARESADDLHGKVSELRASGARLAAELEAERSSTAQKLAVLERARAELSNAFQALSAQALQTNNQAFIELATQTLGKFQSSAQGELEKRTQAIGELVAPVKETLAKLDGRIGEIEKTREGAYHALTTQVRALAETQGELRRETSNLVNALRQPAARGRWGELQLRRVVEMAGMLEYCDFEEQVSVRTEKGGGEAGALRPDIVVRLPGGKTIVVDAKTPLSAYLEAVEAQDEAVRRLKLADHARQVREHVTKLGRKSYQDQFESSPDFVVLFLPADTFYSAALEFDPELIQFAVRENVLIVTPGTLIGLLRAVAYGWKQEALAQNAAEISALGRELYERLGVVAGHWKKVGASLGSAVAAYNQSVGSLETRVLVSARKFRELKAGGEKEMEELAPVELMPRRLQAPEMAGLVEA